MSFRLALSGLLVLSLVACGGSGTDPIFKPENSFGGPLPAEAKIIQANEFAQLAKTDGFMLDTLKLRQERKVKAEQQFKEDEAALKQLATQNPAFSRALLEPNPTDPEVTKVGEDYLLNLGDTSVRLLGKRAVAREAISSRQKALDPANQLEVYTSAYELAPANIQSGLPSPDSLKGASYQAIMAAINQLETALAPIVTSLEHQAAITAQASRGGLVSPLATSPDFRPPGFPASPTNEEGAGAGLDRQGNSDNAGNPCGPKLYGLYNNFWWPLKPYHTSIKNQGKRGSCTSFALTSALETMVAVRRDRWVNLSEQQLYFRIKGIWDPDHYGDGAPTDDMAEEFSDSQYLLPFESNWNYNPSFDRVDHKEDEYYSKSCDGYSEFCSNSTHQGEYMCTTIGGANYCGYHPQANPNNNGFRISGSSLVWSRGLFDLPVSSLRLFLLSGVPMVAAIEVNSGFKSASSSNGFVSSTNDDYKGGHAVHIVGYLSNSEIKANPSFPVPSFVDDSGGGYFIIKNSWSTCKGDGGYFYAPVWWARAYFKNITAFNRGDAPNFGNTPPELSITKPSSNITVVQGNSVALEVSVSDAQDGNSCCDVSWSSNIDGPLGSGKAITRVFNSPGSRTITATAKDSKGVSVSKTRLINVNGPPKLEILKPTPGQVFTAGPLTPIQLQASVEDDSSGCCTVSWRSSLDGDMGDGTSVNALFANATLGNRVITATATDASGLSTSKSVTVELRRSPPSATIELPTTSTNAYRNIPLLLRGKATSYPQSIPCSSYQWALARPGAVLGFATASGCETSIKLDLTGEVKITLTVTDASGQKASDSVTVNFQELPAGPWVRITNPLAGAVLDYDDTYTLSLERSAGSGNIVPTIEEYKWELIAVQSTVVYTRTPNQLAVQWKPSDTFTIFNCDPPITVAVRLTMRLSTNDTAIDAILVKVSRPCIPN